MPPSEAADDDNEAHLNSAPSVSRVPLALIAILCGGMGFVEAMAAVPAQSTAIAGDGLLFLRESALAWIAMWVSVGAFRRTSFIARAIGAVMVALGAGVMAVALARLRVGSAPEPISMALFGGIAFVAQLATGILALRSRGMPVTGTNVWRVSRDSGIAHLLVIAAGAAAYFVHTNMADIAVGAAIAALFAVNGVIMLFGGRLPEPAEG